MTMRGMILGTAAYMSPEQAKGKPVDKRADIWAFGCVLYEMLAGRRAFEGEDVSETLAAILRGEPDWTRLPALPSAVRTLLRRCVERDWRRRVASMSTVRFVLEDPEVLSPASAAAAQVDLQVQARLAAAVTVARRQDFVRRLIPLAALAVVAIAAAVVGFARSGAPPAPAVVMRFPLLLREGEVFPGGTRQAVAISPDGAQLAYIVNGVGIFVRSMAAVDPRLILSAGPGEIVLNPVFSPNSDSIVFWSSDGRSLKKVAVNGGAAVTICAADEPFGMTWDSGAITFGGGAQGILRVADSGGTPAVIVAVNDSEQAGGPQLLPDGDTLLFTLATGTASDRWDRAQIVAQSLRSGTRKLLVTGGSDARYLPTGHLVYAHEGIVFAVPVDQGRLEVTGGSVPVVEGVRRSQGNTTGAAQFSVSRTGSLVYLPGPVSTDTGQFDLGLIDRQGGVQPLGLPRRAYLHPRASPNGKRLVVASDDGKEAIIWVYDLASTTPLRRLTLEGRNRFPIWSADGERIAFQSDRAGDLGIFWQRADGSGIAERLTTPDPGTSHMPQAWLPGGDRFLAAATRGTTTSLAVFALGGQKPTPIVEVESPNPINASVSADGRWIAYVERSPPAIYVQPFPANGDKYLISNTTAIQPVWSRTGLELMSQPPGGQWAVQTITAKPSFAATAPQMISRGGAITYGPSAPRNFDTMPDGRILAVVAAAQGRTAVPARSQMEVVVNWFEELKQKVPVP